MHESTIEFMWAGRRIIQHQVFFAVAVNVEAAIAAVDS